MDSTTTPNRRVQKLLDAAAEHGWNVSQPNPDDATWLLYPHNDHTEGFLVYGQRKDSAKVLRADSYSAVTQRDALAAITAHHHDQPQTDAKAKLDAIVDQALNLIRSASSPLQQTGVTVRTISGDDQNVVTEAEYVIPEDLPDSDKSEFSEGALMAAATVARLLEDSVERTWQEVPDEVKDTALVTPPSAAHAYLFLANQLRDPKTLRLIFKDRPNPSEATIRGAQVVCTGIHGVWQAFADGLFALNPDQGAPIKDFITSLREHAEYIRTSADETFGEFVTATDADIESLLS